MSRDIGIRYRLAIYVGLIFYKLKIPSSFFAIAARALWRFWFFRYLNFVLVWGDEIQWLGRNEFVLRRFNERFTLGFSSIFWLESYFETRDKITFVRCSGKLYARVQRLKLHVPYIASVIGLNEIFLQDCYGFFNVQGAVVLDIGAFIGDTPIYFARKGAKKVVGYEPISRYAEMANENIALNDCDGIAEVVNAAVGAEDGFFELSVDEWGRSMNTCRAKKVSIRSAIESLGHVDLLKVDCEGAEWEIIPQAVRQGLLEKVDKIVMEVHGSNPERMLKLLAGARFKIKQYKTYGSNLIQISALRA